MVYNGLGWDTTEFAYNYKNLLAVKKEPFGRQAVKETQYQYDKVGNKISETTTVSGTPSTVTYVYDGLARMVKRIDPLGKETRYVYDENGNRIKEYDPRAYAYLPADAANRDLYAIRYEYDALNRVTKATETSRRVRS